MTSKLPKVKRKMEENGTDEPDSKKAKLEVKEDPAEKAQKEEMKKQNKKMFYYRDLLKKHCKKAEMYSLLEHNKQEIPQGEVSLEPINTNSMFHFPRTEHWIGCVI